jgi:PPM family protein phosphatase
MTLLLRAAVLSDVGLVRTNNEDSVYAGRRLLAIADGIGGQPSGELASDLVVTALKELDEGGGSDMRRAITSANQRIRDAAEADPGHDGMGTTVTAMLFTGDRLALLHIGDSRAYVLRDGVLTQLTKDDTYVQSLVDHGVLSPEEARRHPQRSIVTRAVQGDDVAPAEAEHRVYAGDRYLLCSDGLSDYVTDEAIAAALRAYPDLGECAEALVKLALQAGAPDNVSVVVGDTTAAEVTA